MDVLQTGGYPEPLLEFLETVRGKERYEWRSDRDQTFSYLNRLYPDERGSVLYAIYVAYAFYLEDLEALQLDSSRTNWEKWAKRTQLREHYFKGKLKEILFPYHPSEKSLEFLYYAEDYIQKNPLSYGYERKRHLTKKRNQMYSADFYEIRKWEDRKFQTKILSLIYAREMQIMAEYERSNFLKSKMRELEDEHFWN